MTLTITLAYPPKPLWPNARVHWAVKARAVKLYRLAAKLRAINEMYRQIWPGTDGNVIVDIVFITPTKRLPDEDNACASLKAAFDGLADAGVVANDRQIKRGVCTIVPGTKSTAAVTLIITPA